MDSKESIAIIDRVIGLLNQMPVVGIMNVGRLWSAVNELERLRVKLEKPPEARGERAKDNESEEE